MKSTQLPNQAVPIFEKDDNWKKSSVDAIISRTTFQHGSNQRRAAIKKLYDYYHGETDPKDYDVILKPYGGKEIQNFPAELRTYPLIKPAVDLLVGEKIKRPFNFSVVINNPDVITIKEEAKKEAVLENMYQWFINRLNEEGIETGMESEEVELPEHVEKIFERNWKDHRAIMAQNAIRFLIPYLRWEEKQQKGFFDFLVSGYVYSHRGVFNNEPYYEILNPLEVDYDKDPNVDFVEDGSWAVIRELATRSSIVDKYHKSLTKEQITQLQRPKGNNRDGFYYYDEDRNPFHNEFDDYAEVCTVYWKSLKLVKIRMYRDEYGEIYEDYQDEHYTFNPETDISIEEIYINEVWQGIRIDDDIYIDIEPYSIPRASIDNPSKVKLPINGRTYSNRNSSAISFVMLGIPFQLSYDIFKYRLEAAIAKSKDMLAIFDINMIPEGWDMDKFMALIEATGVAWVDYAKEGMQFNPQHQAVLDLSIKTIEQYLRLLQYIREEWEQISGVTRQRMGEMSQYEGKATGEQAIIQSSHITEDMFRKYSYFEERDLQALIDYSQIAWINGKKAMYSMPDGSQQYLELDEDFVHAEYGIHVLDAAKEQEKIQEIKQLTGIALEQGSPMSMIAEMIESDSFIEMKEKIKEAELAMEQLQQVQQEAEQEAMQAMEESKERDRAHEKELKVLELNNKIELEMIKQAQNTTDDEDWKAELERRKVELEEEKLRIEERIKNRELAEKERNNKAKEKIDSKKASKMSKSV